MGDKINTVEKFLKETGFSRQSLIEEGVPTRRQLNKKMKDLQVPEHITWDLVGYFLYD